MKLKTIIAGVTLALTTACAPIYQAKIDNQHRCERSSEKNFKLFKDNKLLVEKVSRLNDVFDFYNGKTKIGRLNFLPDGSYVWKPKTQSNKIPSSILNKIKKCNETLENKYEMNFLTTKE